MKVSLALISSCAGFSSFAYVGFFPLMMLACEMSNPWGGVEDDMIFIARTVIL